MTRRVAQLYAGFGWRGLTAIGLAALAIAAVLAFSRPIVMMVDGERVDSDVAPVTTAADKAFVPVRSIADALGAEIEVDPKTGAIFVVLGNQTLRLKVGDTHARLNGMPLTLRHAPFEVRGRVMIALDVISRAFDVRATYDPRTARISVVTPGVGQASNPSTVSPVPQ